MKISDKWKKQLFLTMGVVAAALLLPTTILLAVGMLPSAVIFLFDRTPGKSRALAVGAMNLAGCMPFVMDLWSRGHTIETSFQFITDPRVMVIMYFAAAIGYMIEWAITGLVASILVQQAKSRIQAIEKRKADLERRWGAEVSGRFTLDADGFPLSERK